MRIISSLGAEARVKKGKRNKEDTFGMDDEDWNVYRAIVRFSGCGMGGAWSSGFIRNLSSGFCQACKQASLLKFYT